MTREKYLECLKTIISPTIPFFSEGNARLKLGGFQAGYGSRISEMEGFARLLWGLASVWKYSKEMQELIPVYQSGLANGTNPEHEEYWGEVCNRDQRIVEMAAIAYGLLMVPDLLWEPLSEKAKKNLGQWLYQVNGVVKPENNWQFFGVLTNIALKKCGMPYSQEDIDCGIRQYESYYLGKGWYGDGKRPQKDYYVSFGIHFYSLLYTVFMKEEDPERCRIYQGRAEEFAETFIYWFDEEGRGLPFGRSMTYRFAQVAFFSAYLLADLKSLPPGLVKSIITKNINNWMEQPIMDNGGIMTVGYYYPNLLLSEGYNSPGSPYWSLKAFAFLALHPEHPLWEAEGEEIHYDKKLLAIPECNMLIQHVNRECIAYTAGQYPVVYQTHGAEKYSKFAYSTAFGFSVPRSYLTLEECAPDSMLVFKVNEMLYVRRKCTFTDFKEDMIESTWSPTEGIEVTTRIIPLPAGTGHRRRHEIRSELTCTAYDCGFAYPRREKGYYEEQTCDLYSKVKIWDENGYSSISSDLGEGMVIRAVPNTNLIFPNTAIPAVKIAISKGITIVETKVAAQLLPECIKISSGDVYEVSNK